MATDSSHRQQFETLLSEFHEALVSGRPVENQRELPDDLSQRLRGAQDCVARLHAMWICGNDASSNSPPTGDAPPEVISDKGQVATIGRFEIERELGHGGAGIVLLARDPKLGRRVALKVPRPEGLISLDLRQRFLREAEAAARLSHPHIVSVYEVGEAGPICYIAAEYCSGSTLAAWLAEHAGPVAPREAAALVADLASGVHHAHVRGVLHRDLKPSNVLLSVRSNSSATQPQLSEFVAKVGDFGLAKLLEREADETRTGTVIGTPQYMAPEQAEGRVRDIGVHTDVHALGAMLYELLTGGSPYQGATETDTLRRVLLAEPSAPRSKCAQVPQDLQAICLKCLEKVPSRRYASAAALEEDLRRFLAGQPTQARPLGTVARAYKWARRRPALAALIAVSSAAVLTVIVGSMVYGAKLQSALTETQQHREKAEASAHRSRQLLYTGEIRRARLAWENNRVSQVLEILDQQRPRDQEADLREFSWYYLRGLCEQQSMTLVGHQGEVFGVAWSEDGRYLASAGKDGTVRIWDAADGRCLEVLHGHSDEVTAVVFAPDGKTLASASEDHTVRLWDVPSGTACGVLEGHADHVLCLAYDPSGKWLASGGRDRTVRVWDATGSQVTLLPAGEFYISSIDFSRDGKMLVAGDGGEGTVYCWQAGSWQPLASVKKHAGEGVENMLALEHSPERDWIAGGGRETLIHLWETTTDGLRPFATLAGGHASRIHAIAWSPRQPMLASADKLGAIQLWDLESRTRKRTILGHRDRVWSLAWSPDGRQLASSGADGTVRVWDSDGPSDGAITYPPLPGATRYLVFSPDSRWLVASSMNGSVYSFDTGTYTLANEDPSFADNSPRLRFSADGQRIASRFTDGSTGIRLYGASSELLNVPGDDVERRGPLCWSPDGKQLCTTFGPHVAAIIDSQTGVTLHRVTTSSDVLDAGFSPDGLQWFLASDKLRIYDAESKNLLLQLDSSGNAYYSADSRVLAVVSGGDIHIYDAKSGSLQHRIVADADHVDAALSPDGKTLAVSIDGSPRVVLWDTRTSQELLAIDAPGARLRAITFSPNGDRLVATGESQTGANLTWQWSIHRGDR